MTSQLPTEDAIEAAYRAQTEAHDTLESVVSDAAHFAAQYELDDPDPMPTLADVGGLFLLVYYTRLRVKELAAMADALEESLPMLGEIPANAVLRRAAA